MKLLPVLFALLMLTACNNQRNIVVDGEGIGDGNQPPETSTTVTTDGKIVGTVHVSDTGCPLYIDAIEDDKKIKMYPVNLDENLKIEGMRITFSYAVSRAPQPAECNAEQVVSVSDASRYRGH